MKVKTVLWIVIPFLLAFALGASPALSRTLGYEGWFGVGAREKPRAEEGESLADLEKDLELDSGQRDTFHGFRSYCSSDLCICRQNIADARANLVEALLETPHDMDRIDQMRRELLVVFDDCQQELIRHLLALKKNLTPGQMERLSRRIFPAEAHSCGGCRNGSRGGRCKRK
jgi:hypothetical protein